MNNTIKKISAIGLSLTTAVCLSGATLALPTVALGATTAELQAQITALLAQIQALQAQLGTAQGTTSVPTITRDLTLGSTGDDVKTLQQFLNAQGYAVAASGVGSLGNETTTFGSLTKAALAKYQAAKGISPAAGYFGAKTRTYLSSIAATGTGTGTGTTGTTTTTTTTTAGTEGSFTVSIAASPAAATLSAGTKVPVYGIDIKVTGSDMTIDRLDLQLAVVAGAVTYNPSSFITKIYVLDGSTEVMSKSVSASDINQDAALAYWTRLTGLNFKVPVNTTKTLTIAFDTVTAIDNNRTVTINVYGVQGIRGVDTKGLNSYAALGTQRAQIFRTGGASVLTVSLNSSTPLTTIMLLMELMALIMSQCWQLTPRQLLTTP